MEFTYASVFNCVHCLLFHELIRVRPGTPGQNRSQHRRKEERPHEIDHSAFDALLKQVVKGDRVDYAGLVGDQRLVKYIETIAATNPETLPSDDARLAFYINAYNALTLQSVLTHWPTITSVSNYQTRLRFLQGGSAHHRWEESIPRRH